MGIDKSNVSFVVHYNMPKNIESYYQEAGRAGRDGEKAHCVLLFSAGDIQTARFLINNSEENEALSQDEQELVRQRDLQRLDQMAGYCKTTNCLRSYLLNYFGQNGMGNCDNCGNCTGEMVQQDITVEAQKILSAVARVENKYRSGLGLDRLSTYGIMHDTNRNQIRDYIDHLIHEGYLILTAGEYPVLRMTEQAKKVLSRGKRFYTLAESKAELRKLPLVEKHPKPCESGWRRKKKYRPTLSFPMPPFRIWPPSNLEM